MPTVIFDYQALSELFLDVAPYVSVALYDRRTKHRIRTRSSGNSIFVEQAIHFTHLSPTDCDRWFLGLARGDDITIGQGSDRHGLLDEAMKE